MLFCLYYLLWFLWVFYSGWEITHLACQKDWTRNSPSYCKRSVGYLQCWKHQKEQDRRSAPRLFTANRPSQDSRKSQPSPVTRRQWRQSRAQVLHYTSCVSNRRLRGAECGAKAPYHLWTVLGKNGDAIGWVSSYLQWAADLQSTVPGALQVLLTSHVTKFCLCLEWLPLQNPSGRQGVCTLCCPPCLMMENRAHPWRWPLSNYENIKHFEIGFPHTLRSCHIQTSETRALTQSCMFSLGCWDIPLLMSQAPLSMGTTEDASRALFPHTHPRERAEGSNG